MKIEVYGMVESGLCVTEEMTLFHLVINDVCHV